MQLRFGDFLLDDELFRLERAGVPVALRPKVFDLLVLLVQERARVVRREELVSKLWTSTAVGPGSLSGLVNELRMALGEDGRGSSSIRTVHARGYQFVAAVEVVVSPPETSAPRDAPSAGRPHGRGLPDAAGVDPVATRAVPTDASIRSGVDRARWDRARAAVCRDGARALAAVHAEAIDLKAWMARAMAEAGRAGFEVRWSAGGDGEGGSGSGRPDPREGSDIAVAQDERAIRRRPIALAVLVEESWAWARAGGLGRLLDLLGRAPVLVVAGLVEPSGTEGATSAVLGLDDPRVERVVPKVGALAPVLDSSEVSAPSGLDEVGGKAADAIANALQRLARADAAAFASALRAMGFEAVATRPIRSLRRVEPGARTTAGVRDVEAF